jgi:hypothetical protein
MSANSPERFAVFGLVRGYKGFNKWKYVQLLARNWSLGTWKLKSKFSGDFIIFHEGNISRFDQLTLRVLSLLNLRFVDVSEVWKPNETSRWEGLSDFPLSYSLMCKFNYADLWGFLASYDVVCRVDEDCIVLNLPDFSTVGLFDTGALFEESHPRTNATMPGFLETLGLERFYDHSFPYTNLYVTRTAFWLSEPVATFLTEVANHPDALEYRWGDIPVLGVALKACGGWNSITSVNEKIEYFHLSHLTKVTQGKKADIRTKDVWE